MLDLGAHHGDDPVDGFFQVVELAAFRGFAHDAPASVRAGECSLAFGADIAFVSPDRGLFAMKQLVPDPAVMHLDRDCVEAVHDAAGCIDTDMRLHAKIPVVALLGRRHLRVAGL